jgi:Protein of unknown function (DUF3987)
MTFVSNGYNITDHLDVLTRAKGSRTKYHCPVCNGRNLDIHPRTGAYACFSGGCAAKDIRAAIDLLEGREFKPGTEKPDTPQPSPAWIKPQRLAQTTTYEYKDRNGLPLVLVKRTDNGSKKFSQQHWDGSQWVYGNPEPIKQQIPIYRYQETSAEIANGEEIWVLEGESGVDKLREQLIPATTTIGGSNGFNSYGNYQGDLAAARLVLAPDRDKAGIEYIQNYIDLFPDRIVGVYLTGNRDDWIDFSGDGRDIADDLSEFGFKVEQLLERVIPLEDYLQIVTTPTDEEEEKRELQQDLAQLLDNQSRSAPTVFGGKLAIEISKIAANFNIPVEVFSTCLLPILASQIPAKTRLMINPGTYYKVPAIIWVGLNGDSGTKKSPLLKLLLSPLSNIQAELTETWKINKADYHREVRNYKRKQKDDGTEEPEALSPPRDIYFSDFTLESICQSVSNYPDQGYLVYNDELAGFFKSMDAYRKGGGDRQKWLDFYSGGAIKVNRKGADTLFAPRSSLSILGSVQPSVLERLIKKDDSVGDGLWNRFVFISLPQTQMEAFTNYSTELFDTLKFTYEQLANQTDCEYQLSEESKPFWSAWHKEIEAKVWNEPSNLLKATYSKFQGLAARIALILHCTNATATGSAPSISVSAETLDAAISFTKWLLNQTLLEYQRMGLMHNPKLERVFKFVDKFNGRGWITARQVTRWWSGTTKPSVVEIRAYMAEVVNLGYAIANQQPVTSSKYQILVNDRVSANSAKNPESLIPLSLELGTSLSAKNPGYGCQTADSHGFKVGTKLDDNFSAKLNHGNGRVVSTAPINIDLVPSSFGIKQSDNFSANLESLPEQSYNGFELDCGTNPSAKPKSSSGVSSGDSGTNGTKVVGNSIPNAGEVVADLSSVSQKNHESICVGDLVALKDGRVMVVQTVDPDFPVLKNTEGEIECVPSEWIKEVIPDVRHHQPS